MPFRPLQGRAPQSRAPRSTPLFLEALEERQVLSVVIQGPSSSQTPYLVPTAPGLAITSIMTVGDSVNTKPDGTPYRAVGIMDGLGAYDNGNGTFSVLMNHEIPVNVNAAGVATPLGGVRAHGNGGAFVSLWTIDKATLRVIRVEDFLQNTTSVYLSNNVPGVSVHSAYLAAGTTALGRLCSADLAAATAYGWTDLTSGLFCGTRARIFQTGEEQGGIATSIVAGNAGLGESPTHFGRQWNLIVTDDPNIPGDQARTAYEMPHCGLFAWENNLANPLAQRKTIVAGMDDGNPSGSCISGSVTSSEPATSSSEQG